MIVYKFKKENGASQNFVAEKFKGIPNCIATNILLKINHKEVKN